MQLPRSALTFMCCEPNMLYGCISAADAVLLSSGPGIDSLRGPVHLRHMPLKKLEVVLSCDPQGHADSSDGG